MNDTLSDFLSRLQKLTAIDSRVLSWSAPVPSFGDFTVARLATVGLNPSNREFVDEAGVELDGLQRRFHTLNSLRLDSWREAAPRHCDKIWQACSGYFGNNPYDTWFKQLDYLIGDAGTSYYDQAKSACHLDLVPYATSCKWTDLSGPTRSSLIMGCRDLLARILKGSTLSIMVLNGRTVVEAFAEAAELTFTVKRMKDWELPRKRGPGITGFAYTGSIRRFGGADLGREIRVLGFNHNIQSSFGVTRDVRSAIRDWLGQEAGVA